MLHRKTCQAQKAENTDSRTNYAVKYATARGHLTRYTPTRNYGMLSLEPKSWQLHFWCTYSGIDSPKWQYAYSCGIQRMKIGTHNCIFSLRSCRSSSVNSFWILGRDFWREFCCIFSDPQNKGSRISGKFRSIFCEKIRASKKIIRANFALQTCHPNCMQMSKVTQRRSWKI